MGLKNDMEVSKMNTGKSYKVFEDFSEMALVTAGTPDDFNTMTIGWGALGTIWGKPACTVYVRPSRYTLEFMDKYEYFTVSLFDGHKKELGYLGYHSGRDEDKVAKVGFTPVKAGESVGFKEAREILVCRKMYKQFMDKEAFPAEVADKFYSGEDADNIHYMFIGEVVESI